MWLRTLLLGSAVVGSLVLVVLQFDALTRVSPSTQDAQLQQETPTESVKVSPGAASCSGGGASGPRLVIVTCQYYKNSDGQLYPDIGWMDKELGHIPRVVYMHANKTDRPNQVDDKGKEAICYLRYLIDYYDQLPDHTIFLHGHKESWHSRYLSEIIQAANFSGRSFVNLNWCRKNPWSFYEEELVSNPQRTTTTQVMNKYWKRVLGDQLGPMPERITYYCCAQFAVSREAIQVRSREFYRYLADWLANTTEPDEETSRFFEYTWAIFFGKSPMLDRSENPLCEFAKCSPHWTGCDFKY